MVTAERAQPVELQEVPGAEPTAETSTVYSSYAASASYTAKQCAALHCHSLQGTPAGLELMLPSCSPRLTLHGAVLLITNNNAIQANPPGSSCRSAPP